MNAAKANTEPANVPPPALWRKMLAAYRMLPGGAFLFAIVPLLVLGYFGWYYWGAEHLDRTLYSLKLENVAVTKQPAWIRANIRDEVYRNANLEHISLLDPQATATIAHAFSAHPWVQRASRVRKMSDGKVQVDLIYREPVAMVYYSAASSAPLEGVQRDQMPRVGYYAVDQDGIVLPSEDFVDQQVFDYFLIYAAGATPAGFEGMAFGDSRVSEALELCKLLAPKREAWRLQRIYVGPDDQIGHGSPWSLKLVTSDGREIVWGHAPGREVAREPSVQDKISRLENWLSSVPASQASATLDLRLGSPLGSRFTRKNFGANP